MTAAEAAMTADSPGVLFVEREKISYPLTDQGPSWMNADDIWAGLGGMSGTYGEGVVVGIIDTGIDPTNPSFAAVGGDGHIHTNPYDGCTDGGGCPGAALNATRDQLVADGVDVVNYSIGSSVPTADPWSDSESLQWLSIRNAGIFVAIPAGNRGPGSATISSPVVRRRRPLVRRRRFSG